MKCIQPAKTVVLDGPRCRPDQSIRARFVIEQDDVGRSNHDYGGHRRGPYTYTAADVGRTIETIRDPKDPAYFSWYFLD
jgi:hypothetical protein